MNKSAILWASLVMASCTQQPASSSAPVFCHQWSKEEKQAQFQADIALSHDNALHPVIKDYERVCLSIDSKP